MNTAVSTPNADAFGACPAKVAVDAPIATPTGSTERTTPDLGAMDVIAACELWLALDFPAPSVDTEQEEQ